jgi:hypothetical protein
MLMRIIKHINFITVISAVPVSKQPERATAKAVTCVISGFLLNRFIYKKTNDTVEQMVANL